MSFLFDGILIFICAAVVIVQTKRGFIKSIMHLGSTIASLFVAYAFTPALAAWLNTKVFLDKISGGISETLKSLTENKGTGGFDLDKLASDQPDAFTQILDRYNINMNSVSESIKGVFGAAEDAVESLADSIANDVSYAISSVCAFIAIFCAAMLVLGLLTMLLDFVFRLPVLKSANTLLGFILGVVCAIVLANLFSILSVHMIFALQSVDPEMFNQSVIDNSILLNFFANHNLLDTVSNVIG